MNFLKAFGQAVLKGGAIIQKFLPLGAQIVTTMNPAVGVTLSELSGIIASVEAVGQTLNTPGADKLRAATPLIAQAIIQSDFMLKHKIIDQAKFQLAAKGYAQATVDLLSSLDASIITTA